MFDGKWNVKLADKEVRTDRRCAVVDGHCYTRGLR
jgi:hypothetical protein